MGLLDEYFPFSSQSVSEEQWREMASLWLPTGIVRAADSALNEMAVSQRAAGANMSVDVATGWAWVRGEFGALTSIESLGIGANGTGNPRIDLVVLRADFVDNTIEVDVLVGTPAVAPVEPTLTQDASMWEIALAAVDVAAAAASIVTANIRDRRTLLTMRPEIAAKEPVRVTTTAALAASTVTGVTRVANANGALAAIDGVTLVAGDRLLDKDHATTAQRGLWRVVDPGSASRPWIMERPHDFDSSSDVRAGVSVQTTEGSTLADTRWVLTTNDPIVLGTTGLAFAPGGSTTSFQSGSVATEQSTTSATYVDLTTPGPAATVVVPASGKVLVVLTSAMYNSSANCDCVMGVDISGANTIAANNNEVLRVEGSAATEEHAMSAMWPLTGLTPGSTTFTTKYKQVLGGTAFFANRRIVVIPVDA